MNPFTYRGYQYDQETGLYYLQSRYYNPEWKRFLNADTIDYANLSANKYMENLRNNWFLYCLNNPIVYADYDGHKKEPIESMNPVAVIILTMAVASLMDTYYNSFVIKADMTVRKGVIQINLTTKKTLEGKQVVFADILYDFYNVTGGKFLFECMAVVATDKFKNEFPKKYKYPTRTREFLFSDDCVAGEIGDHVLGYWWSKKKNGISLPAFFRAWATAKHPFSDSLRRQAVSSRCATVDIAEQDAVSVRDRTAFGYFTGIRDCYKYTFADPYWQGGKIRTYQNVRENWKTSAL